MIKKLIPVFFIILILIFLSSCKSESNAKKIKFEIRLVSETETSNIYYNNNNEKYFLQEAVITENDVESADVKESQFAGRYDLLINLKLKAAVRFKDFTENHIMQKAAILINDKVISAPVIMEKIPNGKLLINMGLDYNTLLEYKRSFGN